MSSSAGGVSGSSNVWSFVGPTYPGSGEDLQMRSRVGLVNPINLDQQDVELTPTGSGATVFLQVLSLNGTFNAVPTSLFLDVLLTVNGPGSGAALGFPELHFNPSTVVVLVNGIGPPANPLPPAGLTVSGAIPTMVAPGVSLVFQATSHTPAAANGFFAATHAHEVRVF